MIYFKIKVEIIFLQNLNLNIFMVLCLYLILFIFDIFNVLFSVLKYDDVLSMKMKSEKSMYIRLVYKFCFFQE